MIKSGKTPLLPTVKLALPVPQDEVSETAIVPAVVPKLMVIELVPCPETIAAPVGIVQL